MALTKGDDFPIHQTPEPIAYAGSDRNFYDRYFFNGYSPDGSAFIAVAFGVYPALNVADAPFVVVRDGVQHCLHASRMPGHGADGPRRRARSRIEVLEPLQRLKRARRATERGIARRPALQGRALPIEEPRFIRRNGPRMFMDYTRLTQNGGYQGWIEVDGERDRASTAASAPATARGASARSACATRRRLAPASPQFFWLWSPINFEDAQRVLSHATPTRTASPGTVARVLGGADGRRRARVRERERVHDLDGPARGTQRGDRDAR